MLLVGVLIGRGDGDATSAAAGPGRRRRRRGQPATASRRAATKRGEAKRKPAKGDGRSGKAKKAGDAPTAAARHRRGAGQASDDDLEELQEQSPAKYAESSAKLPDEIATPGAPPPIDNKAAGRRQRRGRR